MEVAINKMFIEGRLIDTKQKLQVIQDEIKRQRREQEIFTIKACMFASDEEVQKRLKELEEQD